MSEAQRLAELYIRSFNLKHMTRADCRAFVENRFERSLGAAGTLQAATYEALYRECRRRELAREEFAETAHWLTEEDAAVWSRLIRGTVGLCGYFAGRQQLTKKQLAARLVFLFDRIETQRYDNVWRAERCRHYAERTVAAHVTARIRHVESAPELECTRYTY